VGEAILQILKEELPQGVRGKVGASILKPNLRRIKQRVDHAEHGGALLLGVAGIAVISHGSSHAPSIFNAIRLAKEAVDNQVLERIKTQYQKVAMPVVDGE
ncbi:MAG TPA: phosphate acyltransferase, partial [Leptolyngbyaceae cyanobacterium]